MPPRASLRQRAATPARSARGNTAALQDTPSGKRSTRAASRQPLATQDVVSNPALPQVQTRQSYAYGSSKTPALPEQLHARDMSMRAVANRLNNAADEAERNFEAQAAEVRGNTPDSPTSAREARAQRRASKEPVRSPPSETPDEVRKKNRVAAWVDSSQLDDITEEDSRQPKTPDRDREGSLPSSFPTGSFNHSYNYERGEREPRLPQPESEPQTEPQIPPQPPHQPQEAEQLARQPSVIRPKPPSLVSRTKARIRQASTTFSNDIKHTASTLWQWMSRMLHNFQKSLLELPESPAISALFKTITAVAILSLVTYLSCTIFTYTCDASSTSIITQSLQTVCGQCRTASSTLTLPTNFNLTGTNSADLASLLRTLQNTQSRLNQMESRLNSRIDSSHASHTADALALRSQQEALQVQIGQLTDQHSSIDPSAGQQSIHNGISSPLIGKINFFSPSSGAVILPHLTSPTRAHRHSLPVEILKRLIGAKKTLSPPPITALEPWSDEGDCWCAAETPLTSAYAVQSRGVQGDERAMDSSQDSIRLAIQTSQPIYPTELIIEHFPHRRLPDPRHSAQRHRTLGGLLGPKL